MILRLSRCSTCHQKPTGEVSAGNFFQGPLASQATAIRNELKSMGKKHPKLIEVDDIANGVLQILIRAFDKFSRFDITCSYVDCRLQTADADAEHLYVTSDDLESQHKCTNIVYI